MLAYDAKLVAEQLRCSLGEFGRVHKRRKLKLESAKKQVYDGGKVKELYPCGILSGMVKT